LIELIGLIKFNQPNQPNHHSPFTIHHSPFIIPSPNFSIPPHPAILGSMRYQIWSALLLLFVLAGCGILDGDESETAATQTATIPTPPLTPTSQTAVQTPTPQGPPPPMTLNIWMVSDVSPRIDAPGGQILTSQLASFDASHPNLNLNVEVKVPTGQGGTLSYLRTGQTVAPDVLPDLIILPTDQVTRAAAESLIYPLNNLLSDEMLADLYPAAATFAQSNGVYYGYPFALSNLTHIVSSSAITETLPAIWDEFIAVPNGQFAFPAAGTNGGELALRFYLAAGGMLANEANEPLLEVEPLTIALNQFSRGRTSSFILLQTSNLTTFSEVWQLLESGNANIIQTEYSQYLNNRANMPGNSYSALPGFEGRLPALVKGWAWSISTPDPARQQIAAELLTWLASGPNLGEWSAAGLVLPARQAAFEEWTTNDAYLSFLQSELERAQAFPNAATSTVISALSTAVFDVISSAKSPQTAAEEAAEAVSP
jgi:ABC-type glycerol-3-phosphate transport system substrate-binding protein